jgi:hypothetical protein
MIKSLSPYYVTTPLISPFSGLTASEYTLQIFVWNGSKASASATPTYESTKVNTSNSIGSHKINIARLVNDFIDFTPARSNTTEDINGNNQVWVKHQVLYTTTDTEEATLAQNIVVDLMVLGYGYGIEGENTSTPTDKILLQGREFNVQRSGIFNVPVLINETAAALPDAINDTYNILYQETILLVLENDDLGLEPTNITLIETTMPEAVGTLAIVSNTVVFTQGTGLVTPQTFDYTITDSVGSQDTATVTLNLSSVPSTVTAVDDYFELVNEGAQNLDVMANDVLGTEPTDIITIVQTGITSGTFAIAGDNLSIDFTPNGAIPTSNETFTYTIEDDTPTSSQGTVTVNMRSISTNNVYVVSAENTSEDTITVEGTTIDGVEESLDVEGGETLNINTCVIESTLTVSANLIYTFDYTITC